MTPDQKRRAREMWERWMNTAEIAAALDIPESEVERWLRNWRNSRHEDSA